MRVIGVLGGVASGKSQVTRMLAELGCGVLDADRAGHEVLREPDIQRAIRHRWGDGVFDDDGEVNRQAVAKIVFAPPSDIARVKPDDASPANASDNTVGARHINDERKFLEQLTHGRIAVALKRQADDMAAAGQVKAIVLDAALLLEAGWDAMCDVLVFVDAPAKARRERAKSRGWTETEFAAREGAQESLEAKRQRADFEIDNSADLEHLRGQVERFWQKFRAAIPA